MKNADVIREAFLEALRNQGVTVQKVRALAETASDPEIRRLILELGNATREIYSVPGVGIINLHIRSEPPGWWNIMKSVEKHFLILSAHKDGMPRINCCYILLIGRKDKHIADGYIATDLRQSPFIQFPGIQSEKYTVNEYQHLNRNRLILTVNKVASTLIQQGSIF